jgi:6-phosphogluconolactonase/glucosamine-6-phosphate isomerase/deaminase
MEKDAQRMAIDACQNCKFYTADEYVIDDVDYEPSYGLCRRFPPRRIDGTDSAFPFVEDEWWCGEHQKKFTPDDK